MSLTAKSSKLPLWLFLLTDAVLVAAAAYIAHYGHRPLTFTEVIAVVSCVIVGAITALVPLIAHYERQKNETLDDRQRALEALASTLTAAAEQIGIAANGLNSIADTVQKNLKHADQLPHKLQEKINEFSAQLDNAREDDREELEKELADLRASETERLQSAADKVHKAVADLTKLEASAQKHLANSADALAKAQAATASALAEAATSARQTLEAASADATRAIAAALADVTAGLTAHTSAAVAAIEAALAKPVAAPSAPAEPPASLPSPAPVADAVAAEAATPSTDEQKPAEPSAPKRPRKSRRAEPEQTAPASTEAPVVIPTTIDTAAGETVAAEEASAAHSAEVSSPATDTPAAELPGAIPAPVPVAPAAEATAPVAVEPAAPAPSLEAASAKPAPEPEEPKPARKRGKKPTPEPASELSLGLETDDVQVAPDDTPVTAADAVEKVMTSDGATRLLVTAYIGIGNRLFVRGEGPGLSWEKGVPLQFVSIGKWRWETAEATAPIACKLYKNDETECTTLGTLTLDPGHQQEVTAKF